jgi:glycosyltransferase involved in cell wall biosynthesis
LSPPARVLATTAHLGTGGIARIVVATAAGLDRARFEPLVCQLGPRDEVGEALRESGIEPFRLDHRAPRHGPRTWRRLLRLLRRERVDLVHTHHPLDRFYAGLAARRLGLPVVSTLHNTTPAAGEAGAAGRFGLSSSARLGDRVTRAVTDRFVAVSGAVRDAQASRLGVPAGEIAVVYPGIDLEWAGRLAAAAGPDRAAALRRELGLPAPGAAGAPVLLTVGRLHPQKGQEHLVPVMARVLRRHPRAVLLIAGEGEERPRLERAIAEAGLGVAVRLLGRRSDVPDLLALSDLFLFPSVDREGLPIAVLEAGAAGRAAVAARTGPLEEVIEDGVNGLLVPPRDAEAMAGAVLELLDDPERRAGMEAAARRVVAERFSLAASLRGLEAVYEQALAGRRPGLRDRSTGGSRAGSRPAGGRRRGVKTAAAPVLAYLVTHPMTARLLLEGQLRSLGEAGFEPVLISSPGPDLEGVAEREGARVETLAMAREIAPLRDAVALARLVRRLRRLGPAIVNAGTPKAGLLGMLAARLAQVPVRVYTLRGLRLETARGARRRLLAAAERLACASAHRVVCVSDSLRRRAVELGLVAEAKTAVLGAGSSNGVDVERFARAARDRERTAALRAELGLPAGAPVVGFVGRFTRDKGIVELAEAFERVARELPAARLVLVGDFEAGDPVPAALAARLRRDPRIVLAGFVRDTAPYYPLMDVLAFPSHREGFPNAPLEAAAAGLPAVGFRVTGTVDAVVDGETGRIVAPGDAGALGAALLDYLRDRDLRDRHGRAARERVERSFRREVVWRAWTEEYRRLLAAAAGERTT